MKSVVETYCCDNERCGSWTRVGIRVEDDEYVDAEDLEAGLLNLGWLIVLEAGRPDRKYCSRRCLEVDVVGY